MKTIKITKAKRRILTSLFFGVDGCNEEQMADDEDVKKIAGRLIDKYRAAFKELAK